MSEVNFKFLQQRHEALLLEQQNVSEEDQQDFSKRVGDYINQAKRGGSNISSTRERDQIRANLRYWANYFYSVNKTFPDTELAPSTIEAKPVWMRFNIGALLLIIVSIGLVFLARRINPSPPPTPTPISTLTSTPTMAILIPTIVSSGPCQLIPKETFPLAVTSVYGSDVTYSWSASRGNVTPSDGPSVLYTAPDMGGSDIIRVEARKDGQSSDAAINCVISTPTPTETSFVVTIPTITLPPNQNATYNICDLGEGKVRVTLNPPEDGGEYSYSPSKEFKAQRDDEKEVVVKSKDGRRGWATIIHIEIDKVYPICSSAPSLPADEPDGDGDEGGILPFQ